MESRIETRHHYDDELDDIRASLVEMGTTVSANIRHAGLVVTEGRLEDVDQVIDADQAVNAQYHRLEEKVFTILALQQPVASDLRFLVAATRILYEMERSGDLAVNIVKQVRRLDGVPTDDRLDALVLRLSEASARMFDHAVEAVAMMDADIGLGAEDEDEETDTVTGELFSAVTERQDAIGLEASVALFYIGRFFERIADHGVNIAQHITFAVTGAFPDEDT